MRRKKDQIRGTFLALPHSMLKSENYIVLTAKAVRLLLDVAVQYNGNNNGDLEASWTSMSKRGWKSRETLSLATKELLHYGFIVKTRQGGLNKCSLFAVTWIKINECGGKFDAGFRSTQLPSNEWRLSKPPLAVPEKQNASTNSASLDPVAVAASWV